jgi:hypothetical protein
MVFMGVQIRQVTKLESVGADANFVIFF